MSQYVSEIRAIEALTPEEEAELFQRFFNGDIEARNLLLSHNLDVVLRVAYKYNHKLEIELDDIINIGFFGLLKAVNNYDESYQVAFKGFAFICVQAEINSYIRYWYREKRCNVNDISLQTSIFNNDDENYELENVIGSQDDSITENCEKEELSEKLQFILSKLTSEEQELLTIRYGLIDDEYRTCEEVGQIVGLAGERVRVKCLKAINKLRHPRITKQIKDYI